MCHVACSPEDAFGFYFLTLGNIPIEECEEMQKKIMDAEVAFYIVSQEALTRGKC